MVTVTDALMAWRDECGRGNEVWEAAWSRMLEVVTPAWSRVEAASYTDGSSREVDGGGALAVALYILARQQNVHPEEITRAQVRQLAGENKILQVTGSKDLPDRWAQALHHLGHDLEDDHDPVARCWRRLAVEYDEPSMGHIDGGFASESRVGPVVTDGIRMTLAPIYADRIQF